MRYERNIKNDAYSYFAGFNKMDAIKKYGIAPELNFLNINGAFIGSNEFIQECSKDIKIFFEQQSLNNYKLYLIANIELINANSRVERYKKVWKALQSEQCLESFIKGTEVELTYGEKTFFSSIAEFEMSNVSDALKVLSKNPFRMTIIASKNNLLTEIMVKDIFSKTFGDSDFRYPQVNYFNLSINLCSRGDIVFRWGDSGEELSIDLIFDPNRISE